MNINKIAKKIVAEIENDLKGRKGIGDEWGMIDEDIQEEITEELVGIVQNKLLELDI